MSSVQKAHEQFDEEVNLSWWKKNQVNACIHFREHFEDPVYVITLIFLYDYLQRYAVCIKFIEEWMKANFFVT